MIKLQEEKYEDLIGADAFVICEGCKRVVEFDKVDDEGYCATCADDSN